MRSMTGFGAGASSMADARVRVEIRALNHRHQDVRVRVGAELSDSSYLLEELARKSLGRGRFEVQASLEGAGPGQAEFELGKLQGLYLALRELGQSVDPEGRISLATLALLPGLVGSRTRPRAELEPALTSAFEQASKDLDEMREREGELLREELLRLVKLMEGRLDQVAERASSATTRHRDRLRARIAELVAPATRELSAERLEQEVAILAEKADVTEEMTRFRLHLTHMKKWFFSSEPQGRKLDFLVQEMNREVNTIGSKSHDEEMTLFVVELKSDLEKLREQVQNIE